MKKNVGNTDKWIRLVLGLVIVALGLYFKSWWGLLAIVPFVTAFLGFCPAWGLLGVNTDKKIKVEKL